MSLQDLSKLCVHTITTRPWAIEEAIVNYSKRGVKGITVWRDALHNRNARNVGRMIADEGLSIVSLCRGGFFPSVDGEKRKLAFQDNKKAIDDAYELGANLVVLVCGADPRQSLEDSRGQIRDGIAALIPHAASAGVRLAIEPLHPMYADSRSAINLMSQANDLVEEFRSPWVGVAVDVYHVWWDPNLESEIARCGRNKGVFAFHICDWLSPTSDLLNDRGIMGHGCIPIRRIREWVRKTGFEGFDEVEIFSTTHWKQDQSEYLDQIVDAYINVLKPEKYQ